VPITPSSFFASRGLEPGLPTPTCPPSRAVPVPTSIHPKLPGREFEAEWRLDPGRLGASRDEERHRGRRHPEAVGDPLRGWPQLPGSS
jgi:hypothetical protein